MKLLTTAIGTALGLALAAAGAAQAQAPAAGAAAPAPQRQLKLSSKAQKPIIELQTAVNAKNAAAIPGLLAAAEKAASNSDDRFAIGTMRLKAAADANDYSGIVAAADVMVANGGTPAETSKLYMFAAQKLAEAKQFPQAEAALAGLAKVDPNNSDALVMRSELLFQQQKVPESLDILSQAIARAKAAGQPVPQSWYSARVARAYDTKQTTVYQFSREWVASAPTSEHWRDTINIYRNLSGKERGELVDMFRLARATKALSGEPDYQAWAQSLMNRGYPSVAVALLEEGAAAGQIKLASQTIAPTLAAAKSKTAGEKTALAAATKTAPTAANATPAMRVGDALFDSGDYAQAAAMYRTALGKPGVDKDLANLRLGMALAMQGDKAGATSSLQAVGPTQSEIAKYWMTYVASRG